MNQIISVALGGAFGAVARLLLQNSFAKFSLNFPFAILFANALGCFTMGYLYPFANSWPQSLKFFILTGFLGSLTTFSGFTIDAIVLLADQKQPAAMIYILSTFVVCVGLCYLGLTLGQKL